MTIDAKNEFPVDPAARAVPVDPIARAVDAKNEFPVDPAAPIDQAIDAKNEFPVDLVARAVPIVPIAPIARAARAVVAAAITAAALTIAAPVAAYKQVCLAMGGAYVADLVVQQVDLRDPERVVNSRHYNLDVPLGQRKCANTAGHFNPGDPVRVLLDPAGGNDRRCALLHDRRKNDDGQDLPPVMAWAGDGKLEMRAGGHILGPSCAVHENKTMWQGCGELSEGGFARLGCQEWRPSAKPGEIHGAVSRGYRLAYLHDMLIRGADPNEVRNGETPLHLAARMNRPNHAAVLQGGNTARHKLPPWSHLGLPFELIENSPPIPRIANINAQNSEGQTPLLLAIHAGLDGHPDDRNRIVRVLLQGGADPDIPDNYGDYPLVVAANAGFAAVVDLLVAAGANPDLRDARGRTPFQRAVAANQQNVARVLHADAVRAALRHDDPAALADLAILTADNDWLDVNQSFDGSPLLVLLAERRAVAAANYLLVNGANPSAPNDQGRTPLHAAVYGSSHRLVRALFRAGANPNLRDQHNRTPLDWALRREAPIERDDRIKIINELLKNGADPNHRSNDGQAALHAVVHGGVPHSARPEVIQTMLQNGADPDFRDADGRTPLLHALRRDLPLAHSQRLNIAKALMQGGADPNAPNNSRVAPIHRAAHRSAELTQLLLQRADPNLQDRNGLTPLHWALGRNADPDIGTSADIVQTLLQNGADPSIPDNNGQTPAQRAQAQNADDNQPDRHREALQLLAAAAANNN